MAVPENKKLHLRTVVISANDKTVVLPGEERRAGLTVEGRQELETSTTTPASPQPPEVEAYAKGVARLKGKEAFPLQSIPDEVIQRTRTVAIKTLLHSKRARAAMIGILIGTCFVAGAGVMNRCSASSSMQRPAEADHD
jgi:hypothetical protein